MTDLTDLQRRYDRAVREYRGACDLVNACGDAIGGPHLSRAACDWWDAAAALAAATPATLELTVTLADGGAA